LEGGINLFAYVENNSLRNIDPYGKSIIGKIVVLTFKGGRKIIKKGLGLKDLVRSAEEGEDVICKTRRQASEVARKVGKEKQPIHETPRGRS
jgi:hypothetical protein